VVSGLGEARPRNVVVLPVLFEEQVKAVVELASFSEFSDIHINFLDQLTGSIGIVFSTIAATMRTEALLKQSQALTQELQQTNQELEEKAEQLALTSKYKSEFLANMSHELRTPLNSLLILAKMLYENAEGNLTAKQVEFGKAIHSSGTDLLSLINDILDLSKIESGTMAVEAGKVFFKDIREEIEPSFRPIAQNKRLDFATELDPGLPPILQTDSKRLHQILRNLLSNAFKFTSKGGVSLRMGVAASGWSPKLETLNRADTVVYFAVADTGIGIPSDKHQIIFEPFQQADMTTSRKYGGTGLGLSISREIARLLGGEIRLESTPGVGSTFTLYLPLVYVPARTKVPQEASRPPEHDDGRLPLREEGHRRDGAADALLMSDVDDDRSSLQPGDSVVLIIEDDVNFAALLLEMAREQGFKGLVASSGEAGLGVARKYKPHAITLDLRMPDMDGWALLDCLKHDAETRHIPVQIISSEEQVRRGLSMGALSFLRKPASREVLCEAFARLREYCSRAVKRLLIVEDDERQRNAVEELVGGDDVETLCAGTGAEALRVLSEGRVDCLVLDLTLPDMTGFELIDRIREGSDPASRPAIIIYTGRELSAEEEALLRKNAEAIIVKDALSPERLLEETSLYLHRSPRDMTEPKRRMLQAGQKSDPVLAGKTVFVADDDVRNIFALTTLLEQLRMRVRYALTGKEAVKALRETKDVDIVLMDIMMPEMDGYEAMRQIRQTEGFGDLPIIALTAKAMKGDRERCIEAGASDYIPKPVDSDRLISLIRVWLYR
jgi:signal transduction histidine kinase/CheY-like chemotaxis protein